MKLLKIKLFLSISTLLSIIFLTSCSNNDGQITIMSFNTQHCINRENIINYDEFSKIITDSGADIICLQEIDKGTGRSNEDNQMKELGERCNMYNTFAKAINFDGGEYGIGMLSKEKPLSIEQLPLPGEEARTMLIAEFKNLYVICTHLALQDSNRAASAKIITEKALKIAKKHNKPIILCGDLNEDNLKSDMFVYLMNYWNIESIDEPTYPTPKAENRIDFILSLKNTDIKCVNKKVITELKGVNVKKASDHFPIVCKFALPKN